MIARVRHLLRDLGGVASVEFALITPVVFALMFTAFEGGHYLWTEHKVIKGVRLGARYAARLPFSNFSCPGAAEITSLTRADGSDAFDDIREVVVYGKIQDEVDESGASKITSNPKVKGWTKEDVAITLSCDPTTTTGIYSGKSGAPRILVNTVVDYPAIYGLLGFDTSKVVVRAQAEAAAAGV